MYSLTRPYRVSLPMIALLSLVPLYIFVAGAVHGRTMHRPALALDGMVPLEPGWALPYGALYFFLIALPVFMVRDEHLLRRTIYAYLSVWIAAYLCFLLYATSRAAPSRV